MTNKPILKKWDLEERTAKFGEDIIIFCKKVPRNPITIPLITQLVKAGNSVISSQICRPKFCSFSFFLHKKKTHVAKAMLTFFNFEKIKKYLQLNHHI